MSCFDGLRRESFNWLAIPSNVEGLSRAAQGERIAHAYGLTRDTSVSSCGFTRDALYGEILDGDIDEVGQAQAL